MSRNTWGYPFVGNTFWARFELCMENQKWVIGLGWGEQLCASGVLLIIHEWMTGQIQSPKAGEVKDSQWYSPGDIFSSFNFLTWTYTPHNISTGLTPESPVNFRPRFIPALGGHDLQRKNQEVITTQPEAIYSKYLK